MPTGSCLCNSIKYEYEGEPITKAECHCLTCRKLGSGSTVNIMVPRDHLAITAGSPKEFTTTHETGMHITTHFCENCGILLYKTADSEEFQGNALVLAGTLDDPDDFSKRASPDVELYTKYRASWLPQLQHVEQKVGF